MQERTIVVEGTKTHVYILGDKKNPPLLLIHSFHNNAKTSLPIGRAFAKKFCVLLPDLPGFGESQPFPKHTFSIETAADFLPKLLYSLHIRRCFLMGISMGGAIATRMIANDPKLFKGLILLHPLHTGSHIWFPHRTKVEKLLRLSRSPLTARLASYLWSNKFIVSFILKKLYSKTSDEYLKWRLQCLHTCTPDTYLAALSSILRYTPLPDTIGQLRTILIYNPNDNLIDPQKTVQGYCSIFEKLTIIESDFDTHNPTPMRVERFLEKNQTFITKITSSLLD